MSSWNSQQNNIQQNLPYWGMTPQYPHTGNYTTGGRAPYYKADPIHGEQAAWQFPIGGGEIYLPDADEDIIWWIRIDQNGQKSVTPFDVSPHETPKQVDMNEVLARLSAVEEWINGKQNKSNAKRAANATVSAAPAQPTVVE